VYGLEDGSYEITAVGQGIFTTSGARTENQQTLDHEYSGPYTSFMNSPGIVVFLDVRGGMKTIDGDGRIFYKVSGKPTMRYIYEW
jgi:hypothetical protein